MARLPRRSAPIVVLAASLLLARPASAQAPPAPETAEQAFTEGRALLQGLQYAAACAKFASSFELGHVIGAELNLGTCAERDGHLALAWQRFDAAARAWAQAGDDERAAFARANADRLAIKLATIVVRLAASSVAGTTVRIGDRTVPAARQIRELVEPGNVDVVIAIPGRPTVRQTVQATVGGIAKVDGSADAAAPDAPEAGTWSISRGVAVGIGSISLTALAIGIVYGMDAQRLQNDAHAFCSPNVPCYQAAQAAQLNSAGHDRANAANVRFEIAGVAAIAAGVLWLAGAPRAHAALAIAPVASPSGQLGLTAQGSF